MFEWDDVRVFLAAAQSGTLSAAGQRLGMDAATVGRRLKRLEDGLRATLVARSPQGLELTAAGARLLDSAAQAQTAMDALAAAAAPDQVSGVVRISASEGFGAHVIAPALPALRAQRPALRVELAAQPGFLSLARREADIAVTLLHPQEPRLVVEPLTDYALGLYAAPAYLQAHGRPEAAAALHGHDIVGYMDDLIYAPALRYLDEVAPGLKPTLASSSIQAQREIIAAGGGIGVLPCFLGAGLARVLPGVRLIRRFWLAAHRDVAESARVRALRAWLKALAQAHAPLLLDEREP